MDRLPDELLLSIFHRTLDSTRSGHTIFISSVPFTCRRFRHISQPIVFQSIWVDDRTGRGCRSSKLLDNLRQRPRIGRWVQRLSVRGYLESDPHSEPLTELLNHLPVLSHLSFNRSPISISVFRAIANHPTIFRLSFTMCSVQVPTLHLSRPFQRLEHLEVKWESTERRRERSLHDLLEDALYTSSRHPSAAALGMLLQPHVRSLVIKSAYLCNLRQVMQDGHSSTLKRLTIDTWHVWSPLGLIQNADEGEIKAALVDILKLCPSLDFLRLGNLSVSEQEHLDITPGMLPSLKTIEGHHSIVEVFCRGRQISTLSIVADISHDFLSYTSLPLRVLNLPGISWRTDTLSSIFVAFPQLEEVRMWAGTFEATPLSYIPFHSSIKRLVLLASTNSNYTPELESLSTISIFDWEDRLLGFHDAQRALVEVLADRCPKLAEARLFGWEYWKNFGQDGWAGVDDVRCLEGSLM